MHNLHKQYFANPTCIEEEMKEKPSRFATDSEPIDYYREFRVKGAHALTTLRATQPKPDVGYILLS
jgi:hypothetical protein